MYGLIEGNQTEGSIGKIIQGNQSNWVDETDDESNTWVDMTTQIEAEWGF
jgi:hypothetical protein